MTRPLIGITCYVEPATRGDWKDVPSVVLPHDYVRSVEQAGGAVLVIPPRADADLELAGDLVSRLDGLIIAGGADVDPDRYAATDRHPDVQEARHDRDTMEIALATAAAAAGLPLLGICRGMQVMAVAAGGGARAARARPRRARGPHPGGRRVRQAPGHDRVGDPPGGPHR
jgi:putative glutamine amidotransferase